MTRAALAIALLAASAALADEADAGADVPVEASPPVETPAPVEAPAPAPVAEPEPFFKKYVEATGYVDSRTSFTRARTWGLIPTDDVPQLQELFEVNLQLKAGVRPHSFMYADVSLVGSWGGFFHGADASGADIELADHPSSALSPLVSINELYVLHELVPEVNLLVGKKRIVWGSGLAYNPTDFLNARRDPTDPTFQRAGVWLAQLEVPLEVMTFSFVFAPTVLRQTAGIPTHMITWPAWDRRDEEAHYQLAARAYALVGDADVNVMAFYGNRSVDDFTKKFRVGLSFSRYFFTDYELHFEALLQTGSTRDFVVPECVESSLAALVCSQQKRSAVVKSRLDDAAILPRLLVGTRRQFDDESILSVEYLWQADGWTRANFQDFANGLDLLREGRAAGLPVNRIPGASQLLGGGASTDGLPARFTFDPRGQHYLFLSYQKPRIRDDFTAQVVLIANLQDLSTLWTPSIAWSATEWLTLTLFGFVPVRGPDSLTAKTPQGVAVSEYGALPFAFRVLFEARAYF